MRKLKIKKEKHDSEEIYLKIKENDITNNKIIIWTENIRENNTSEVFEISIFL
jgi:hypothetical protein